jgi:hypothetical protein
VIIRLVRTTEPAAITQIPEIITTIRLARTRRRCQSSAA